MGCSGLTEKLSPLGDLLPDLQQQEAGVDNLGQASRPGAVMWLSYPVSQSLGHECVQTLGLFI